MGEGSGLTIAKEVCGWLLKACWRSCNASSLESCVISNCGGFGVGCLAREIGSSLAWLEMVVIFKDGCVAWSQVMIFVNPGDFFSEEGSATSLPLSLLVGLFEGFGGIFPAKILG